MIETGCCYLCCQISRCSILIVWPYTAPILKEYGGRMTRPRLHFNGMFGYKDAIDLPFMLLHILHLRFFSFSGTLFSNSLSPSLCCRFWVRPTKFLHQTYKCQVQPIWWADISHWYFIIVRNLHIIFPFFMIYTINISFILSLFSLSSSHSPGLFIPSFYFRFAAFRLFITLHIHMAGVKRSLRQNVSKRSHLFLLLCIVVWLFVFSNCANARLFMIILGWASE